MYTKEQIYEAFSKVKSGDDFPQFIEDLKSIGVTRYDNFVSNGMTVYYGEANFSLDGESKYPEIVINNISSSDDLKQAISIHQQGKTDYPTFCQQAAASGVEKWTTDTINMTVSYFNKEGIILLVESIPVV